MPTSIGPQTSSFTLAASTYYYLLENDVMTSTGDAIQASGADAELNVMGSIFADNRGIRVTAPTDVFLAASAEIVSSGTGVDFSSSNADNSTFVNRGSITSLTGVGVDYIFSVSGAAFENWGSIYGQTSGVILASNGSVGAVNHGSISSAGIGVSFDDTDIAFFNTGTISTTGLAGANTNAAIFLNDFSNGSSIFNSGSIIGPRAILNQTNSSTFTLENTGLIQGAIESLSASNFVTNGATGQILGQITFGAQSDRLNNAGHIDLRDTTLVLDDGSDTLRNSGTILGDVDLGDGADHLDTNGGVISGAVLGGAGNDTLAGSANADDFAGGADADTIVGRGGDDLLKGDGGDDFILGGAGNDDLNGGADNDTVNGNAGDDSIYGEDGNDLLVGQDGSDVLEGEAGQDTMDGGNGDDVLEGGADNDILRGRAGEDDLAGGLGRDFLTGGQDADTFVFRSLAETVVGANRDQILDFEQGVDLITVAGLSPGVFEFRGTSAFDPSGNPELRLFETPTGSTIVQIDADGDGIADAEIRVANVTGLTADDFVL